MVFALEDRLYLKRQQREFKKGKNLALPSHLIILKLQNMVLQRQRQILKFFSLSSTDRKFRQSPVLSEPQ